MSPEADCVYTSTTTDLLYLDKEDIAGVAVWSPRDVAAGYEVQRLVLVRCSEANALSGKGEKHTSLLGNGDTPTPRMKTEK